MKQYTLSEMEDKYIGQTGIAERDEYEYALRMELLSRIIKNARKERGLTQEKLGEIFRRKQQSKIVNLKS